MAVQLEVAWWTIMRLIEQGTPIVEDPQRLVDVDAVGVDETAYLRANREASDLVRHRDQLT